MPNAENIGRAGTIAVRKKMTSGRKDAKAKAKPKSFSTAPDSVKCAPASLPEIKRLMTIISGIAWVNLLVGMLSIMLYPVTHNVSLISTGILSVLTFWVLRIRVRDAMHGGSWVDVCITAVGGIYFPSFVLWISIINLTGAIRVLLALVQGTPLM